MSRFAESTDRADAEAAYANFLSNGAKWGGCRECGLPVPGKPLVVRFSRRTHFEKDRVFVRVSAGAWFTNTPAQSYEAYWAPFVANGNKWPE